MVRKPRFYRFSSTHLINSIKHDHACKIFYLTLMSKFLTSWLSILRIPLQCERKVDRWRYNIEILFFVWAIVYLDTLCVRTGNALVRIRRCAGSSEHLLVIYKKSTKLALYWLIFCLSDSDDNSSDSDSDDQTSVRERRYRPMSRNRRTTVRKRKIRPIARKGRTARSMRKLLLKRLTLLQARDTNVICCKNACYGAWRWVRRCDVHWDFS